MAGEEDNAVENGGVAPPFRQAYTFDRHGSVSSWLFES